MFPKIEASPWPENLPVPPHAFVYDLVYNPAETTFVKQARTAGCPATTGLGMLLHQGAQAFTLWTNHDPDRRIMADAVFRR
jgi:shikimate dehydrogenase